MKSIEILSLVAAGVSLIACSSFNETAPKGSTLSAAQVKTANVVAPSRAEATFNGMYTQLGAPDQFYTNRADDFAFIMLMLSEDLEGPDAWIGESGYNWFSACGELSTRNADYANPYIRYATVYSEIAAANSVITSYPEDTKEPAAINKIAQARAIRAYSYLNLAPYFQFKYVGNEEKPCVPIVTEKTTDFTNNPRASVKAVYDQIISDLNYACDNLDENRTDKSRINKAVALGLRARAYLNMEDYDKALADAQGCIDICTAQGIVPTTPGDYTKPLFYDINEKNWIWGYDMKTVVAQADPYCTVTSWLSAFSGDGYAAACQCIPAINNILYDKISSTDIRKQWWLSESLHSDLLEDLVWTDSEGNSASGDDIPTFEIKDVKMKFYPYANVKFGSNTIGGTNNDDDYPFMRIEEMNLIKFECLAHSDEGEAKSELETFIRTYRDPSYSAPATRTLLDEIWFQRRVELWGEGFSMSDIMRLGKPVVRFHDEKNTVYPAAFCFNIPAGDGWLLLRFTTSETNTNAAIVDNTDGTIPVTGQFKDLKDGVTD
ncbi:MAG: RagB/SusD family nutrient uptake outer membrane protein [Bacteroidales bacterium]|nr:RagB/SusD family nutrient uptake outer membrane protein [Bacteroidales bacterium]